MEDFTKRRINSHPEVKKAREAKGAAARKLSKLKEERDQLSQKVETLSQEQKNVRVGAALGEMDGAEVESIGEQLSEARSRLQELEPEIEAQEEALEELRARVNKAWEQSYRDLKPKARAEQKKYINELIEALENVARANDRLVRFQNRCHSNLNISEKHLSLSDSRLSPADRAGSKSFPAMIKELKEL